MAATTNGTTVQNFADIVVQTRLIGTDGTTDHGPGKTTIHRDTSGTAVATTTDYQIYDPTISDTTLSAAEATELAEDMIAHWTAVKAQLAALSN